MTMHDMTAWLLLPEPMRRRLDNDAAFADAFLNLVRGMPDTARLVVRRALKKDVLDEMRRHFAAARLAPNDDERNRALSKAHDLLASFDSYEPASIGIRNAEPSVISHNWSPGLAAFQYAHNNTFVRAVPVDTLTIPLPPAA